MRFNFKKISAIATSVLLTGMTMGIAAAANYPAPFVSGSSADVAIVYGTGAGVSSLDQVEATNIQSDLGVSGVSVVSGGEPFKLEKLSDSYNFNNALDDIYTDLTDEEMDSLADGTYDDGDIDEDYTQTINLHSNGVLTLFADSDYNDDEPTLGFHYEKDDELLNYVIEFDSTISMEDMEETDLPLFGKNYYVLDVENGTTGATLTLLDSAEQTTIEDGETVTFKGKQVSVEYIDDTDVKLTIDGESTEKLGEHEYEELADGSYVVVNENLYAEKDSGTSKVEISIGSGKMVLEDTKEIEVNDETVDGLYGDFDVADDDLTSIQITWKADDDLFLTEENSLTMPLFESVSLVFGGMDFPSDPEEISFASGNTLTLEMGNLEIELMNSENADEEIYMGADGNPLVTKTPTLTANYTGTGYNNITKLTGGLDLRVDDRFIATILDADLGDIDQVYYEVTNIDYTADDDIEVELTDLIGDNDMTFDEVEDKDVPGTDNLNINITGINTSAVYLNFTGGAVTFNKVVSEKGLLITLPAADRDDTVTISSTLLTLEEQDDEADVGEGLIDVSVGVSNSSNDKLYATCNDADVTKEEVSDDNYLGYFESALATEIETDESGDEYKLDVVYFGEEVIADVEVAFGGTVSTSAGVMVVKDSEVSSVSGKNLIVVGGSCINSVAASIVGGSLCGSAFTSATGVGNGQFLIESVASPLDSSKIAVLVAGYEVADTQAASAYLRTQTVDTTVGKKGVGTTGVAGTITFE